MNELPTMPLRFRVWDKREESFCESTKNGDGIFDLIELSVFFMRHAETGRPHTDFEVTQDTGCVDKNGKHIFMGDIVETDQEERGVYRGVIFYMFSAGNVVVGYGENYCDNGVPLYVWLKQHKVIGNIWQNPELLEEFA